MIEGAIRHGTSMTVEGNYVDSRGQSEIGFAITRLLGFDLLPRIKQINRVRLYRPSAGELKHSGLPETYACTHETDPLGRDCRELRPSHQIRDRYPTRNSVYRGDPASLHTDSIASDLPSNA